MPQHAQAIFSPGARRVAPALVVDAARLRHHDDGYPAGLIRWAGTERLGERGRCRIRLMRCEYATGEVSVLVSLTTGSVTDASSRSVCPPLTVAWANGEIGVKLVTLDCASFDGVVTVAVAIGNPTGGAVIAPDAVQRRIRIASDRVYECPSERGGRAGWLLASLMRLLRWPDRRGLNPHGIAGVQNDQPFAIR